MSLPQMPPPPPPLSTEVAYCNTNSVIWKHRSKVFSPEEEVVIACDRQWNFMTSGGNYLGLSTYHPVKPFLQDGPQCGLVALCAAGELLLGKGRISIDAIQSYAKSKRFTSQGEMFSVQNMSLLAKEILGCETKIVDTSTSASLVFRHLLRGWPLLVPYDADGNHEPCLKKGHSAHWAVIIGFCLVIKDNEQATTVPEKSRTCNLYHVTKHGALVVKTLECLRQKEGSRLFVYARQGKSRRLGVWCYKQLCDSNKNLQQINPKYVDSSQFVLPEGGLLAGLQGKMILLFPQTSDVQ